MEPAQPADRVPDDPTPPEDQPPVDRPALVEPPAVPADSVPTDDAVGTGEHPAPPAAVETGKSERSPKDMAISLLILLIPIALLLAFYRGVLGGEQPTVVDPAPAIDHARSVNAFPVAAPAGLGDGWRPVTASFRTADDGSTLRIGYVTPEGRGAQLVQSDVPAERLLPAELTEQGQPQGRTDLSGSTWQRYTARGNEQALVLLEPDRTVIVIGDAGDVELRHLASAVS